MIKYFLIFIFFLAASFSVTAKEEVVIYTYHLKAPFITSLKNREGLSFDLIKRLNQRSKKYIYKVVYLPRKRLDLKETKKIVLWSNPNWVNDEKEKKYFWSKKLVKDSDVFISHVSRKLKVKKIEHLLNKKVVGIFGYYYPGIDPMFTAKKAERIDVKTEHQIISMISSDRYDVGIVSYTTLMYPFSLNKSLESLLSVSDNKKTSYFRKIYYTKDMKEHHEHISKLLDMPLFIKDFSKELSKNLLHILN